MVMIGINDLKIEEEFNEEEVKYFGTEVSENFSNKGKFKSFKKQSYVRTNKKLHVNYKISEMRKWFDSVELINNKEHLKRKGEKIIKAFSKTYEVIKENTFFLPKHAFKTLIKCNETHNVFDYKNVVYYYIMNNIYRNNNTYDYLFIDNENEVFEKTGYDAYVNIPTKNDLLNWIQERG